MPSSLQARNTRIAISPRFATSILLIFFIFPPLLRIRRCADNFENRKGISCLANPSAINNGSFIFYFYYTLNSIPFLKNSYTLFTWFEFNITLLFEIEYHFKQSSLTAGMALSFSGQQTGSLIASYQIKSNQNISPPFPNLKPITSYLCNLLSFFRTELRFASFPQLLHSALFFIKA